jgi:hypothetical protein
MSRKKKDWAPIKKMKLKSIAVKEETNDETQTLDFDKFHAFGEYVKIFNLIHI